VIDATSLCNERLGLHLELNDTAEEAIAKITSGGLELQGGTRDNLSVNIIVIAFVVVIAVFVLIIGCWSLNKSLGLAIYRRRSLLLKRSEVQRRGSI
jgi:hypothetical protein